MEEQLDLQQSSEEINQLPKSKFKLTNTHIAIISAVCVVIIVTIILVIVYTSNSSTPESATTEATNTPIPSANTESPAPAPAPAPETAPAPAPETAPAPAPETTPSPAPAPAPETTPSPAPAPTPTPIPISISPLQLLYNAGGARTCLDGDGTNYYFNNCDVKNDYQKWNTSNNKLKHTKSGKCLDYNGTNITWNDCNDNDSQKWIFNKTTKSYTHKSTNKCLEVNGNSIRLNNCDKNYYQTWDFLPENSTISIPNNYVLGNGVLSYWYYDPKKDGSVIQGPFSGCSKVNDIKEWAPLPVYISGTGKENIHWKYTENPSDPECVNNWTYYDKDKKTILGSNINRITKLKDNKNWCMLNKYISGGDQDLTWAYCQNNLNTYILSFTNAATQNQLCSDSSTPIYGLKAPTTANINLWTYSVSKKNLVNVATGKCLYNKYGSHDVGIDKYVSSKEFKWDIDFSNGIIKSLSNGYCLENGGGASSGAIIKAYANDNNANKRWDIKLNIKSYNMQFANNLQSKLSLEHGGDASKDNLIKAYPLDNTDNKKWIYNSSKSSICSKVDNKCIRNPKGSNDVEIKALEDTDEYKWTINLLNKTVCSKSNNYCLENGGGASSGNDIKAYADDNTNNKKWDILF